MGHGSEGREAVWVRLVARLLKIGGLACSKKAIVFPWTTTGAEVGSPREGGGDAGGWLRFADRGRRYPTTVGFVPRREIGFVPRRVPRGWYSNPCGSITTGGHGLAYQPRGTRRLASFRSEALASFRAGRLGSFRRGGRGWDEARRVMVILTHKVRSGNGLRRGWVRFVNGSDGSGRLRKASGRGLMVRPCLGFVLIRPS